MNFTLNEKLHELTKEDVERAMAGVEPEIPRQYFVLVKGKKYPPKQVLAKALNLRRTEFTTMAADSILRRLGFEIRELNN